MLDERLPAAAPQAPVPALRGDLCAVIALMLAAYGFFMRLDPLDMLQSDTQPFDSSTYLALSDQMLAGRFGGITGEKPFCFRLLQPALVTIGRWKFGLTYAEASHGVNAASAMLATLLAYAFWRRMGLSRASSWFGVALITTSFLGPLRCAIVYPGSQYAFEVLTTWMAFLGIRMIHRSPRPANLLPGACLLFAATVGRENVLYLTVIAELVGLGSGGPVHPGAAGGGSAADRLKPTLFTVAASGTGYLLVRLIVSGIGDYSMLRTVLRYGWFHLNIGETLYLFFFTLGPLFLCFILCMSLARARRIFFARAALRSDPDRRLAVGFCAACLVFAMIGGSDSERFLLWSFPFFFWFGLLACEVLLHAAPHRTGQRVFVTGLLAASVLWSRCYVPAAPHLLLIDQGDSRVAVRTNLNPRLFRGPALLAPLRNELVEMDRDVAYSHACIGRPEALPDAFVAKQVDGDLPGSVLLDSYRFAANNIPFPLGFAHNQNELLAIHPYHGYSFLRAFLLAQWILLAGALFGLFRAWEPHAARGNTDHG